MRNPEDAADLLQDAFARLAAIPETRVPKAPEAYLQRVVRNLVTDRARRAKCRPAALGVLDDSSSLGIAPDQEQNLALHDLQRLYREAVSTLSPRTREVFLLHRVEELTYAEVGGRLGISVATVEYHIGRALVHLDRELRA